MNPALTTVAVAIGCLVLASAVWAAAGGRRRAPGALADVAIRAAAGLTTLALMGIAGAISYQHLLTLALIWSCRPDSAADLGIYVVDMSVTGWSSCPA
jgi:hypothetical protein